MGLQAGRFVLEMGDVAPDEPGDLPAAARRLLLGAVDSFEKLEVLLALHETAGGSTTLDALGVRAGVPVEQVERAMSELAGAGLVEHRADGRWGVAAAADAAALTELSAAWATSRTAVLKTMTERAVARIRASAARAFADAFRLRRGRDEEDDDG